ncbi:MULTISPECIES: hypothetical protein [Capnocytophaga]|uniref:hypothetical protein n=1 Tax=Capnocytophaga TaxID=1016 RepID=UPI000BB1A267|nr:MULTISPECIES: hypothetical protein [Capnocytophaga]ATA72773.1 hypothetical protein CGC49_05410 [Capnocytophaga sp. H4358]GIM58361.1 hypothetical protein CAPN007_05680 [Capnocytophaga canimorsus]
MKKNVVLIVSKEETFIRELAKVYTSVVFEFADNAEQAIEKLNLFAVGAILADATIEEQEILKIKKIAGILDSEIIFEKADFKNMTDLEKVVINLRNELFRRRMSNYTFEDNPNLNNPFLNLDKTNIFKKND